MKILLITSGPDDPMTCQVVHGLYNVLGENFTHSADYAIMYKDKFSREEQSKMRSRGFTIYQTLEKYLNDNSDIENKIKNKYFDKILIDFRSINNVLTDLALSVYSAKDMAYLDVEDLIQDPGSKIPYYQPKFLGKIKYFKREKIDDDLRTYPLAYSIPLEKFNKTYTKNKKLANVVPHECNNFSKYIYTDEKKYYEDYGTSYFGLTTKKGGWDCLRHYEILSNYCIPLFPDLELCPPNTMFNFPKKEIIDAAKIYENFDINFNEDEYYTKLNFLYKYTINNLTTVASAKYIIDKLNE